MTADEPSETWTVDRWRVGFWVALAAGASGLLLANTALFVTAIVGVSYALYAAGSQPPALPLAVERTVTPAAPDPGDLVTVTVAVENLGDAPVVDLRIGDAPPAELSVEDSSPRHTTSLRPGETATYKYIVRAGRGTYAFGDVVTLGRSATGTGVTRVSHDVQTKLACHRPAETALPVQQTIPFAGRIPTDSGGEGIEFYSVREHQPTDSLSRIDWRRYAKTGELRTVEYRETKAARIVFVVDADPVCRRRSGEPDTAQLAAYATIRAAEAHLDTGNKVGVAVLGGPGGYLAPGGGTAQSIEIRAFLTERFPSVTELEDGVAAAGSVAAVDAAGERTRGPSEGVQPDGGRGVQLDGGSGVRPGGGRSLRLRRRLPPHSKVVFVSSLLRDRSVRDLKRIFVHDHPVTVLSPDVTHRETLGGRVATVDRRRRVREAEGIDPAVRVVDWSIDDPLETALTLAEERWSS